MSRSTMHCIQQYSHLHWHIQSSRNAGSIQMSQFSHIFPMHSILNTNSSISQLIIFLNFSKGRHDTGPPNMPVFTYKLRDIQCRNEAITKWKCDNNTSRVGNAMKKAHNLHFHICCSCINFHFFPASRSGIGNVYRPGVNRIPQTMTIQESRNGSETVGLRRS